MNFGMPKDPQRLSSYEAQMFLQKTISTWEPSSEVWHFKYGGNIAAIMGCLGGINIMYRVRRTLKLREHARMTCYIPVAGMASFLGETFHDMIITPHLMAMKSCPVCLVTEAAMLQAGVGVVYPLVFAPLIGFYLSDRLLTYPVPSITRAPKELFQLWWKIVSSNPRPLIASGILQGLVMGFITQQKQNFLIDFVSKK